MNDLPIFPLGMPLFAGGVLPLQIFEARYLDMVSECSRHDKPFGVCMITRGGEAGKAAEHAQVGTLATIRDFDQTEAGLLYIRTLGSERFRILRRWIQDNGLIRAEVLVLDDRDDLAQSTLESSFAPLAALLKQLHGQLKQQARCLGQFKAIAKKSEKSLLGITHFFQIPAPLKPREFFSEDC